MIRVFRSKIKILCICRTALFWNKMYIVELFEYKISISMFVKLQFFNNIYDF